MYVKIKGGLELYDMTPEQRTKLKDLLTFDNPKYEQAKRFSRNGYISIPPYLTYYNEVMKKVGDKRVKSLLAPIGTDLTQIIDTPYKVIDERVSVPVIFPQFVLELRADQEKAVEKYLNDDKRNIVQLPTGKGKTILALYLSAYLRQRTLILVHKDDLVTGWKKDIDLCFDKKADVGLIKAKSRTIGKHFTIATVQTLNKLSAEEMNSLTSQFGLVIQDECHHVGINIFNIIHQFNSVYKLGLSATPKRSDGLDFVFDLFFGGICYKHEITENDEDISQVKVIRLNSPFRYRPFLYKGQVFNYYDFEEKDLPKSYRFIEDIPFENRPRILYNTIDDFAVKNEDNMSFVCQHIISEYKKGRSVLAMFTQKEHIDLYFNYLKRFVPEKEIMLYYGDNHEKSSVLMKKAEDREVNITLATYAKATEGTNVKAWEVLFLVSSLNNAKNVEQALGRIRRRKDGKIDPVLVYDIRYNGCYSLRNHGDTRDRVYKSLKCLDETVGERKSIFKRGYNRKGV